VYLFNGNTFNGNREAVMNKVTWFVSLICLVVTAAAPAATTRTNVQRPSGLIAFSAGPFETGTTDIYTVRADGSELRRLTGGTGSKFDPALSPDGQRIVFRFQKGDDRTADIYAMNVDGSRLENLTRNRAMDYAPSWSPDGQRIVFASDRGGFFPHIYVMDANGSNPRRVGRSTGEYPSWSPDGRRIAFGVLTGSSSSSFEIFVMRADGSKLRRLTRNRVTDNCPSWSPGGRLIVFHRDARDGLPRLYVMRPGGSDVRRLSSAPGEVPDWSPDGRYIVYSATGLAVTSRDGSYRMPLDLRGLQEPGFPSWSIAP
jgi:Tol biopolymer transport system component